MHDYKFLPILLIILSSVVTVVWIFRKLKLSPVLGYFITGAAFGEHGLKIISSHDTEIFGEFGVVFLLFAIGLELTFERLMAMRKHVFGLGGLQVAITAGIIYFVMTLLNYDQKISIITSCAFALSSTAIVMQVIVEQRRQSTQVGRLSLAILLMQDFAVVPLLVLIPLMSKTQGGSAAHLLGFSFLKAAAALTVIFVSGRIFLRPLFRAIYSTTNTSNHELFIATNVLIILTAAWVTERLGLSMALGAFVAGLLVAETEYHIVAEESITPFKGLLLGLFFMTVGMSLDFEIILSKAKALAIACSSLILIKTAVITSLCLIFRFGIGSAIHAGFLLSQGGEFAFILFGLANELNVMSTEHSQFLMVVVTITMAITPLLSYLGDIIAIKLDKKHKMKIADVFKDVADLENHVLIIGFGRVGKMVAKLLEAEQVNYIACDINREHVDNERKEGYPLFMGDASDLEFLGALGIKRAKAVVITIDNQVTSNKCTKVIRNHMPDIPIVIRSKDLSKEAYLKQIGATMIVPETYETGLQMGGAILKSVGVSEYEVSRIKNKFRAGDYVMAIEEEELNEGGVL